MRQMCIKITGTEMEVGSSSTVRKDSPRLDYFTMTRLFDSLKYRPL